MEICLATHANLIGILPTTGWCGCVGRRLYRWGAFASSLEKFYRFTPLHEFRRSPSAATGHDRCAHPDSLARCDDNVSRPGLSGHRGDDRTTGNLDLRKVFAVAMGRAQSFPHCKHHAAEQIDDIHEGIEIHLHIVINGHADKVRRSSWSRRRTPRQFGPSAKCPGSVDAAIAETGIFTHMSRGMETSLPFLWSDPPSIRSGYLTRDNRP